MLTCRGEKTFRQLVILTDPCIFVLDVTDWPHPQARTLADRTREILCLTYLGWLCVRLKQPAQALAHLRAGLKLAEQICTHFVRTPLVD